MALFILTIHDQGLVKEQNKFLSTVEGQIYIKKFQNKRTNHDWCLF